MYQTEFDILRLLNQHTKMRNQNWKKKKKKYIFQDFSSALGMIE